MNKRIEKLLSRDHSIGHSYFMCVYCIEDLKKTFYNKVIPLLQEYFFGDYGKIGLVLGEGFFENLDNENDLNPFATFFEYNGDDFADKTIYRLKSVDKMKNEEFMEAIGQLMSTLS